MRPLPLALAALALVGAAADPGVAPAPVHPLELRQLHVQREGRLALAPAVEALRGQRVRVRGFMVQLEEPLRGEFYLAPRPVEQDESGGGTADVPVDAVLVRVPGLAEREIPWRGNPVEVEGTLEVGREESPDGRVSWVRVILAEPSAT
jgi:hypothetical protein